MTVRTPPRSRALARFAGPAATALVAAGAVAVLHVVDPNEPGHYPTCPFLAVTGLHCPGCGSLRALRALSGGDLLTALDRNPLLVLAVPYLVVAWAAWLLRAAGRRLPGPLRRLEGRPAPAWVLWVLVALVTAFWVLRNLSWFAWLAP